MFSMILVPTTDLKLTEKKLSKLAKRFKIDFNDIVVDGNDTYLMIGNISNKKLIINYKNFMKFASHLKLGTFTDKAHTKALAKLM